jgi:hypothetical protein
VPVQRKSKAAFDLDGAQVMRQHAGSELCEEIADDAAVQRARPRLAYKTPAGELAAVCVALTQLLVLRKRHSLAVTHLFAHAPKIASPVAQSP